GTSGHRVRPGAPGARVARAQPLGVPQRRPRVLAGPRMITREEAERAVADGAVKVVYRAPHVPANEPGEEGVITGVNDRGAFVRYGGDTGARMTPLESLTLISASAL